MPEPPNLVADHRRIAVGRNDLLIADSRETYRILETAGPPTFYISPRDIHVELLKLGSRHVDLRVERRGEVLGLGNLHTGAAGNRLELSERASPFH